MNCLEFIISRSLTKIRKKQISVGFITIINMIIVIMIIIHLKLRRGRRAGNEKEEMFSSGTWQFLTGSVQADFSWPLESVNGFVAPRAPQSPIIEAKRSDLTTGRPGK